MAVKKKRAVNQQPKAGAQSPAFPIVGIGASAGGFEAFAEIVNVLPVDTGMAFVLIQHLDPTHESMLAPLLARKSKLPVSQVTDGVAVEPDHVYVIPPNTQMVIRNGSLELAKRPPAGERNLPIDYFFRSLATYRKEGAIGVILSGTATDGTIGLEAIKAEGGICFAQDEASAKYFGMPASAIAAGCVDFVLPPKKIAAELVRIGRDARSSPLLATPLVALPASEDSDVKKVLMLIRNSSGVDFTHYKANTIHRRILRRMLLRKIDSAREYLEYLRRNGPELAALHEDLLIHVTSFFREPEMFEVLRGQIFPRLLAKKADGDPFRIWVPGCSTGEEAYSIAIGISEFLGERLHKIPIQIFATDISERSIEQARAGIYAGSTLVAVSPELLQKFFTKSNGSQRVTQSVRDMCTFARQDLIKDPPFSRIDLISCRNVLIYLEPVLQRRVISAFHYALNPDGLLLLSKTESLNAFPDLFIAAQKKPRFYQKKIAPNNIQIPASVAAYDRSARERSTKQVRPPVDLQKEADRIVWSRYAHSGIIVDQDLHILHFRGDTSVYLAPASGAASLNLLKMIRGSLLVDLRAAFRHAKKENIPVKRTGIQLTFAGQARDVSLEVLPLSSLDAPERQFLILLEEAPRRAPGGKPDAAIEVETADSSPTAKLEQELLSTREYLQAIIEEQETTNEELTASNEEALSNNEELQSANEELETAKEELQSTNEELVTLTEQQTSRNIELGHLNDDLRNVLEGIEIPVLMLDNDQRIRRFTPAAEKLFNLLPTDVGRPIQNLRPNLEVSDLTPLILRALDSRTSHQQQVKDLEGRRYSMTVRPYRTSDNQIDGVLVALEDIDELTRSLDDARRARDLANAIVETAREILVVLDSRLRVVTANRAFHDLFRVSIKKAEDHSIFELAGGDFDNPELRNLLEKVLPERSQFNDFRLTHEFPKIGRRILLLNGRRLESATEAPGMILLAMEDITDKEVATETLQENEERLRDLAMGLLTAQEEERRRISRELHDDLNQRLAMLAVELETLEKSPIESAESTRERLSSLRVRTEEISDDVRRTAHQLHPSMVDHLGLPAALRSLCGDFSRQEKIRVTYQQRSVLPSIPAETALCLFRVTQEALRNVATHSGASRANVSLVLVKNKIRLTVSDTGQGFARGVSSRPKKGLGILSMEERVRLTGGSLKLHSEPGHGTRVVVEVPVRKEVS